MQAAGLLLSRPQPIVRRPPTSLPIPQVRHTRWGSGVGVVVSDRHATAPSLRAAANSHRRPNVADDSGISNTSLKQLGFTDPQAAAVLSFFTRQKRNLNISDTAQWVQILDDFGVKHPTASLSKNPIILQGNPAGKDIRLAAVVQWMSSRGLTDVEIAEVIGKQPMVLNMPLIKVEAVTAWLVDELGWSDGMINTTLQKMPTLFGLNPVKNLAPKLAWLTSRCLAKEEMSKVLHTHPQLLTFTVERNEVNVSALMARGLSDAQVAKMLRKMPQLLGQNIPGLVMQLKMKYLVEVMEAPITTMVNDPHYLARSLKNVIGPRWTFSSRYGIKQPTSTTSKLSKTTVQFLATLKSESLDAECENRGLTRLQVYEAWTLSWQSGEGRWWCRRKEGSGPSVAAEDGTLGDESSAHDSDADDSSALG